MKHYRKIVGEKCYLSPVNLDDADRFAEWSNDMEVALPLGGEASSLISRDKEKDSIAESIRNDSHVFAIVDLNTDGPIGRVLFFNVNFVDRNAMIGIMIGDKSYWNKGYGTEAINLALDYGFNLLNLNNIMLGTFSFNERALNCYRKVGFKEIGRRRQARIIGDRKYDVILMDMLAEEYRSVYVSNFIG